LAPKPMNSFGKDCRYSSLWSRIVVTASSVDHLPTKEALLHITNKQLHIYPRYPKKRRKKKKEKKKRERKKKGTLTIGEILSAIVMALIK